MVIDYKRKEGLIVPDNDGESQEIQKLLTISHHRYLVTSQKWGAS